jgi:hypothetical protein
VTTTRPPGRPAGIVNLLGLYGVMGMVGVGRAGSRDPFQATVAVAMPVIWFQMVNRSVIVRRYSAAESRWRPGRKCGEIPLKADRNRWA